MFSDGSAKLDRLSHCGTNGLLGRKDKDEAQISHSHSAIKPIAADLSVLIRLTPTPDRLYEPSRA